MGVLLILVQLLDKWEPRHVAEVWAHRQGAIQMFLVLWEQDHSYSL